MESEGDKPQDVFRILSYVFPGVFGFLALISVVGLFASPHLFYAGAGATFGLLAVVAWIVFDRLDKTIPQVRRQLRKKCEALWHRYGNVSNLVGIEPAVAPEVGAVLDEAASIYSRHRGKEERLDTTQIRAREAIEAAMERMLDLASHDSVRAQALEFDQGWAIPLLREMRKTDQLLSTHSYGALGVRPNDPLAMLREARADLEITETARIELDR
jgi:hypothetical protein